MKDNETFILHIDGEPVSMYRHETKKTKTVWSDYTHNKCKYNIQLENQYEHDLIEQPIDMILKFFVTRKIRNQTKPSNVMDMFRFINSILKQRVYKEDTLLNNVILERIYDKDPHTEIIITLCKEKNGKKD